MAIAKASTTSSALRRGPMAQPHDPAGAEVQHPDEIQAAFVGAELGDIGHPPLVRFGGAEVAQAPYGTDRFPDDSMLLLVQQSTPGSRFGLAGSSHLY